MIAWIAIVIIVGLILFAQGSGLLARPTETSDPLNPILEIQARYLVGTSTIPGLAGENLREQVDQLFGHGPLRQQLLGAVLIGELVSANAAEQSLNVLLAKLAIDQVQAEPHDTEVLETLRRIQGERLELRDVASMLKREGQQKSVAQLEKRLGWVGKLAQVPPGTTDQVRRDRALGQARNTLLAIVGVFAIGCFAITCGLMLQVLWWIFVATGRVQSGIDSLRGNSGLYAETFAVWLVLLVVLEALVLWLPLPKLGLIWMLIPQAGSLAALGWPVLRGLRWRDVCEDLGLRWEPQTWLSPFIGLGAYLCALPMVVVAMLFTLLMMAIVSQFIPGDGSVAGPMHPVAEPILHGSWTIRLQLLFLVVFAAIPEEIMFRGVLYRHLREASSWFGDIGRVIFATAVNSLIFAAIHPQGIFGIPLLMSLAIVFSVVREWRGSLVPSMIAHALVNAGTTSILLLIGD